MSACQSRPKGVSQGKWIRENGMTPNQYYYWQRKVRKAAYLAQHADLPQATDHTGPVDFVDLPAEGLKNPSAASISSTDQPCLKAFMPISWLSTTRFGAIDLHLKLTPD